jgi:Na+-transporting NADH:ubiquinone oxidoreductase subunit C
MQKDSVLGTVVVATLLCVVCSILVSGAAVSLKDKQEANRILDVKKNLLLASGIIKTKSVSKEQIEAEFSKITAQVIDLETGEVAEQFDPETFDQREAARAPETSTRIPADKDLADIKSRSKFAKVYKLMNGESVEMYIFPVYGKGLWSTMYGFLAMEPNLKTVKGIGFYQHGETPGLGGEIENPKWQSQWVGKKAFGEGYDNVKFNVTKGQVNPNAEGSEYQVDGLSGATITSNGVTATIQYWLGPDGFGPYIKTQVNNQDSTSDEDQATSGLEFKKTAGEA